MKRIAIVAGGDSPEWVISVQGAELFKIWLDKNIFEGVVVQVRGTEWVANDEGQKLPIDKNDFSYTFHGKKNNFDCALINIHGTPGENGLLQSYFELLHIPYTSCGVLCSALTFNKQVCKTYLQNIGIKSARGILIRKNESFDESEIINQLSLPCFVKPNKSGSSVGVSKVNDLKDLKIAIHKAFVEDDEVLIEEFIQGTEITNGVLTLRGKEIIFPITEIVSSNEFFDYEAKYTSGKSNDITPARISNEFEKSVKSNSSRIYKALNCKGIVRIDYIIHGNDIYFLEVNTIPGMSPNSIIPQQIQAMGLTVTQVYTDIINAVTSTN